MTIMMTYDDGDAPSDKKKLLMNCMPLLLLLSLCVFFYETS